MRLGSRRRGNHATKGASGRVSTVAPPYRRLPAGVLLLAASAAADAQFVIDDVEDLAFDRPESWAMKYYASVSLMTGLGQVGPLEPGRLAVTGELDWVPQLSASQRRVGFNGFKEEDFNRTRVFGRARVSFGLPLGLVGEVGWTPPAEINGLTADIWAVGLRRPFSITDRWTLMPRLAYTKGTVEGDITCPERVAGKDDLRVNPFGCEVASADEYRTEALTAELTAAYRKGDFQPYFSVGYNRMDLEVQVDARVFGVLDQKRLRTDGTTWYGTAGLAWRVSHHWQLSGELFYSALDVKRPPDRSTENDKLFNVRFALQYRFD